MCYVRGSAIYSNGLGCEPVGLSLGEQAPVRVRALVLFLWFCRWRDEVFSVSQLGEVGIGFAVVKVKSQFKRLFGKRSIRLLVYGFALYCAVTVGAHYFAFVHPHPDGFDKKPFQDLTIALWANVVFVGTFGFLAAVVSLFRPEEDSLDKRLGYLYPLSSTLSGDARARLGKSAMRLAGPAVAGELHFVVDDFNAQKNAYWLTAYISFTLRNILQDEFYEDEIEILVAPDIVDGVDPVGHLIESSLVCSDASPSRVVHFVSLPIFAAQRRFQEFVEVSIPPKSEAIHSYTFSSWAFQGVPFEFYAQRYSENIKVQVTNRTGVPINCSLSRGTNNPTVTPECLDKRTLLEAQSVVLKQNLILDGSRENLQLVLKQADVHV